MVVKKYCFCYQGETIHHVFITCLLARMVWRIVFLAFNITPPTNITNMVKGSQYKIISANPSGFLCFNMGYLECAQ